MPLTSPASVVLVSVIVALIAWGIGDSRAAENLLIVAALVAGSGGLVRAGYSMGRRSGMSEMEAQIAELYARTDQLDAIHQSMINVENMISGRREDDNVVRPFPRQQR